MKTGVGLWVVSVLNKIKALGDVFLVKEKGKK